MLDQPNKLILPEPLRQFGNGFKDIFYLLKIHIPLYTRQSAQDISRTTLNVCRKYTFKIK